MKLFWFQVLLVAALVALAMGAPAPGPSPHPNPNPAFLAAAPVLTPLTYSSTYNYRSPYYSAYSPYAVSPYAYNLGKPSVIYLFVSMQ